MIINSVYFHFPSSVYCKRRQTNPPPPRSPPPGIPAEDHSFPPGNFDFTARPLVSAWHTWQTSMEGYIQEALRFQNEKQKKRKFLDVIGPKGREIYLTLEFQSEERERTVNDYFTAFEGFCVNHNEDPHLG